MFLAVHGGKIEVFPQKMKKKSTYLIDIGKVDYIAAF